MPAYMFIKTKVFDREQYMKYVQAAQALGDKHGRKFLVMSQPVEVLEGSASVFGLNESSNVWPNEYLLVSEWPSAEAARAFWNSTEYREIRELRVAAGEVHVLLTEPIAKAAKGT